MRRFGKRGIRRREMIAMVTTSVFVLGALTVTGLYIKNRNEADNQDGYYIDFDALEAEIDNKMNEDVVNNDLDYTGITEEYDYTGAGAKAVQSGNIEKEKSDADANTEVVANDVAETLPVEETIVEAPEETAPVASSVTTIEPINFSAEESLTWPVVGKILINYSMDKTVYFPTLDQYKYSPAVVVSANVGEHITAATEAVVTRIYETRELGNVVEMDLGDGYTLTYGQVHEIAVSEGQYVTTGQLVGKAGKPTGYYSVEGCNVYMKLTKDGQPVDPMTFLE